MSDTQTATPQTRNRFKGELTLGNVTPEAAPSSAGIDLTPFLAIIDQSWKLRQENEEAAKQNAPAPHAATALGVTIPKAAYSLTETRFRQAAGERGLGVSLTKIAHDTERGKAYGLTSEQLRVIVEARPKKKAPAKKPAGAATVPPAAGEQTQTQAPANPAAAAKKAAGSVKKAS